MAFLNVSTVFKVNAHQSLSRKHKNLSCTVKYQKKINHSKLYRIRTDPLISIKESSPWLKHGNMQPREEGAVCPLQDRIIFLEKGIKCPHCRDKYKSVDHMATQCDRMLSHDYMRRHNEALRGILI